MKLSFIVTFHNGDRYISECLDSLLKQDIPYEDYEIIVVDDCSTSKDGLEILDNFERTNINLSIIHNEYNLRTGASRNVGLKTAKGEYIWFIDQDDYIEKNCLSELLNICAKETPDILTFDYFETNGIGSTRLTTHNIENSTYLSAIEYFDRFCSGSIWGKKDYCFFLWHCLYRREYLQKNSIYNPEIYAHEDIIFSINSIFSARKIISFANPLYYFRYVEESDSHKLYHQKAEAVYCGTLILGQAFLSFANKIEPQSKKYSHEFYDSAISAFNALAKSLLRLSFAEKQKFYQICSSRNASSYLSYLSPFNKFIFKHQFAVLLCPHILLGIRYVLKKCKLSYLYDRS